VRDLQKNVRECVDIAQEDRVVVTRHGRPAAVLVGVEGRDWEDVALQMNSTFWKMIERRRREPTIPLAEARRVLQRGWDEKKTRGRKRARRKSNKASRVRAKP